MNAQVYNDAYLADKERYEREKAAWQEELAKKSGGGAPSSLSAAESS